MPFSGGVTPTHRAMVFVDGTNLFHRLSAARLRLTKGALHSMFSQCIGSRAELIRICLYTSKPHWDKAVSTHENEFATQVRTVLGDAIPKGDGNFKEKGVDAMLVADLVYHAATRNITRAVLVSVDTDFTHAISRVEDFGCNTIVVGVCAEVPTRLREATDQVRELDEGRVRTTGWGVPI
jgi:uncharacterized LabA/DUF88 family protein